MIVRQTGFTIMELIITIGIFVLVTGSLIANFNGGEKIQDLRLQADLYASHLRSNQSKAVSGISASTLNGYGIELTTTDPDMYRVFADSSSSGIDYAYDSGEQLELISFPTDIAFSLSGAMDIVFTSPSGAVYVNGALTQSAVTSTIVHADIGKSIDIVILPLSGQISVSDPY